MSTSAAENWPVTCAKGRPVISIGLLGVDHTRVQNHSFMSFLILRFLRASAMLKHIIDIGWMSVRPSVCLSVTRWYCIKTAEYIVMHSSPHDSPFILVLCLSRSSRNSDGVTPCGAAKQRWGVKISQFSTNNLLYLKNG